MARRHARLASRTPREPRNLLAESMFLFRKEPGESSLSPANLLSLPYSKERGTTDLSAFTSMQMKNNNFRFIRPRFDLFAWNPPRSHHKSGCGDTKKLFLFFRWRKSDFRGGKQSSCIRSCNRINCTKGNTLIRVILFRTIVINLDTNVTINPAVVSRKKSSWYDRYMCSKQWQK